MTQKKIYLAPCPFCHGENLSFGRIQLGRQYVQCLSCGASGPISRFDVHWNFDHYKDAAEKWNRADD